MIAKQTKYFLILIVGILISCNPQERSDQSEVKEFSSTNPLPQASPVSQSLQIPVRDFDGLEHLFHQDTDTTYVINFWATWCKPCVAELPYFEQLGAAYTDQKLKVILISLDFPKQIEQKLVPFIQKNQIQSEVWVLDDADANTWIDKVSPQWSGAIPATVVYKRNKREFWEQSFENYEELNAIVQPFLKK